ncbi:MAG: tRNA (adenosine(37)-N6)-threonylcarbamoyltransferase complex dimerization subunit type 1 TsaB [Candidatus Krumholzibacteria bacterium]|nr:tRNA (adenosine(37)-N6)-threonylcarbamoyltransferase complex dimerization subunit type 1 TsaB [Candidatus Krumholzibacteria bacterium]
MKPLVLALDASHMMGSVAVTKGSDPLHEIIFDASDTHSATLMPAVDECLAEAGVEIKDIDLFVTVIGPGSFTGLRIGLATVKGFAAVARRPVAAVGSLELIAADTTFDGAFIVPLIDARRGEVYTAMYDISGDMPAEILPPFASAPGSLAARITATRNDGDIFVCGSGLNSYRAELEETFPAGTRFGIPDWIPPSAGLAATLALERDAVPYKELSALEPLYIRPPDAKLPSSAKLRPGGGR